MIYISNIYTLYIIYVIYIKYILHIVYVLIPLYQQKPLLHWLKGNIGITKMLDEQLESKKQKYPGLEPKHHK